MKYNITTYNPIRNFSQKFFYGICKRHFYYLTSSLRVLPDFFVIGAVRTGTTSLFHYLNQHPCVRSSAYDELGFFDDNFHLGINWYRSLFPTQSTKNKILKKYGKFLTYDVTPFYIYNPLVARRIVEFNPKSPILANLRNPVDRAYSNYMIAFQDGDIDCSFEEIIDSELVEIENSKSKLNDESFLVDTYYNRILSRGFYVDQLKIWYDLFPHDQLFMTSSEELSEDTGKTLKQIFEFLKLSNVKIHDTTHRNKRHYPPMKKETRDLLIELYKPYNEKLFSLIGKEFDWSK